MTLPPPPPSFHMRGHVGASKGARGCSTGCHVGASQGCTWKHQGGAARQSGDTGAGVHGRGRVAARLRPSWQLTVGGRQAARHAGGAPAHHGARAGCHRVPGQQLPRLRAHLHAPLPTSMCGMRQTGGRGLWPQHHRSGPNLHLSSVQHTRGSRAWKLLLNPLQQRCQQNMSVSQAVHSTATASH